MLSQSNATFVSDEHTHCRLIQQADCQEELKLIIQVIQCVTLLVV